MASARRLLAWTVWAVAATAASGRRGGFRLPKTKIRLPKYDPPGFDTPAISEDEVDDSRVTLLLILLPILALAFVCTCCCGFIRRWRRLRSRAQKRRIEDALSRIQPIEEPDEDGKNCGPQPIRVLIMGKDNSIQLGWIVPRNPTPPPPNSTPPPSTVPIPPGGVALNASSDAPYPSSEQSRPGCDPTSSPNPIPLPWAPLNATASQSVSDQDSPTPSNKPLTRNSVLLPYDPPSPTPMPPPYGLAPPPPSPMPPPYGPASPPQALPSHPPPPFPSGPNDLNSRHSAV